MTFAWAIHSQWLKIIQIIPFKIFRISILNTVFPVARALKIILNVNFVGGAFGGGWCGTRAYRRITNE